MKKYYILNINSPSDKPSSWSSPSMDYLFNKELLFVDTNDYIRNYRNVCVHNFTIPANRFKEVRFDGNEDAMIRFKHRFNQTETIAGSKVHRITLDKVSPIQLRNFRTDEVVSYDEVTGNCTDEWPQSIQEQIGSTSYSPKPDSTRWSATRSTSANFINDHLKNQIRVRYSFSDRPRNGLSSTIVDTYFPMMMYKANMSTKKVLEQAASLPRTSCAISGLVANLLGVRQVPVEQLCRTLGYTSKDIRKLLLAVKEKSYRFVFIGAGGTGINGLYWLTQLCEMTSTVNLFKEVMVYEKEKVEISNLFRFPLDPRLLTPSPGGATKLDIARSMAGKLSRLPVSYVNAYIPEIFPDGRKGYTSSVYSGSSADNTLRVKTDIPTVLYGAPSLQAREDLSKYGHFLAGTHANTSCHLWLNPEPDVDISVESYGMIQLGGFFMNQLRMVIAVLEFIGQNNIDWMEKDKELLNYTFDGERKLTTDKAYQWQMDVRTTVMTEEEANNV